MNPVEFRKRLIGGLDKDTNLNEVKPTDFIDGYDVVDKSPKSTNENGLLQPCSNTKLAYDIGIVEEELTKRYKVVMDLTSLASCNLLFNIELKGFYSGTITVAYTLGDDAATTLTNIENAFLANASLAGTVINPALVSGFLLNFDIDIVYFENSDYFLTVTNSLGDVYSVRPDYDAVSLDKLGIIYPICFANVNNDQQIFGTSNTLEPSQIETILVAAANDFVYISFTTDPLIPSGEEVYLYPQSSGGATVSGLCTLEPAGLGVYQIIGSFNPFAATPAISSTSYYLVRNYRTLSIIGYAQKDDMLDTWYYTELLRCCSLNFRPYKQIQGALDITEDGIIYDWTDFLNPLRRLIYSGAIFAGGFYKGTDSYNLDTIELESRLQLGVNTSKVTLQVATTTGAGGRVGYTIGAKKEATYAAFVRFKTSDGAYSSYSKASNVLWLRSSDFRDHQYGTNSGRVLQITIEQIPTDIYDFVQVGIIEFTSTSWVGYSLPEVAINGEETIYVSDSGFNTESYINFNDANVLLEQIPFVFENAKSILAYNNYRLAANANLYQQYDLTDWAQAITLTVVRRTFETILDDHCDVARAGILAGINAYDKCSNEWMSYMPNDTYRFCVFVDWKNGMPTSTYWIEDVNFDLGNEVSDTSATPNLYQYYIEATNIVMNYILPDGKLLKEVAKDIRFGRALCNAQVQTMGCYILSTTTGGSTYQITESYYTGALDANIQLRRLTMYSPDFQNTNQDLTYSATDKIIALESTLQNSDNVLTDNWAMDFYADGATEIANIAVSQIANIGTGGVSTITNLTKLPPSGVGFVSNRGTSVILTSNDMPYTLNYGFGVLYYISPYSVEGAYPLAPQQTKFFVLPQDQWYNEDTHTNSTVYSIYGGDCFPTKSYYKISEGISGSTFNSVVAFYTFNRTNTGLRTGTFPYVDLTTYLSSDVITQVLTTDFPYDQYYYDAVFTPRYLFQNQVAFNPLLPQFTKQFSTLYYSNQSFSSNVSGGNRVWLPLDNKVLETKYGAITHIETLLGQTGSNILIVWQERRVTAQYFDNTANIKSNTGELLIGNGAVLGREGQNFTEFGCEHKWSIVKGQTDTGKDVAYWLCLRKTAIMRFGADGTSNIIGNISSLIENRAILGLFNGHNEDDAPALSNGIHAVWDNKRMEYILTLRLMPKILDKRGYALGEYKASPTLKWGFEQFPVIYKSLVDNNMSTPPNQTWQTEEGYDSDAFEILTIVWNERDNTFKTFRTYSPKIYGQFNDNYVSSHPVQGNLIYEHNDINNQALYYEVETTTAVTATTDPILFRITGTNIQSTFPSPFAPYDREKYIVTIDGKNYEVVGTGTNFLQMANVDADDVLPAATIANFSYKVVNSQDPYITGMCNNPEAKYFHFGQKSVQADDALKRTEYEAGYNGLGTAVTKGFSVKAEEVYQNGTWDSQIRQDTTNSPTNNTLGANQVEGVWMKFKNIFRWGKNNKVLITIIKALETQKTK